jgi:biopolymer transport protein ExbD
MSFGGFNDNGQPAPMAEINVTPMVDVMLVLLVIFILAAPLFTQSIKLDLPAAAATPTPADAKTVTLSIDAGGNIFWDKAPVTQNELNQRLIVAGKQQPQPQLQLRADKNTRYEVIAQIMGTAQANGLSKLGFVTETPPDSSATPAAR